MEIRVGRGAGRRRPVANAEVLEILQRFEARVDAMERRHTGDPEDISKPETEEAEENVEIPPDIRLLRTVLGSIVKPRIEVSSYAGGLNPEELVDWINEMNKCFDYEEISEDKKVKFAVTNLKGHAALWWDGVQAERRRIGKQPIKSWTRIMAKLKGKFLPSDYQLTLFRQMQNLR